MYLTSIFHSESWLIFRISEFVAQYFMHSFLNEEPATINTKHERKIHLYSFHLLSNQFHLVYRLLASILILIRITRDCIHILNFNLFICIGIVVFLLLLLSLAAKNVMRCSENWERKEFHSIGKSDGETKEHRNTETQNVSK